ncbi:MAG: VanZ family protein [Chitinispirillaceae bacterium]|jgi:VanZ family protein|nr:VanZ family protein [Chitinispirillaceae bacterium]
MTPSLRHKIFWWLAIISWCWLIFCQSDKPVHVSHGKSLQVVSLFNRFLSHIIGKEAAVISDTAVRKSAHLFEYFVLGILLFNGFFSQWKIRKTVLLSILFGICYAISDEIHQYFVPGREMHLLDIILDSLGTSLGCLVMTISGSKRKRLPILILLYFFKPL